jgi:hypothetical protein
LELFDRKDSHMSNLAEIERRHQKDHWKDAGFIVLAAVLVALAIGAVTSKAAGKPIKHVWKVTVTESPVEIVE